MISPGRYRAKTLTVIGTCFRNELSDTTSIKETTVYQPGEEIEIPMSVNGYFYRFMRDPFDYNPIGSLEKIG